MLLVRLKEVARFLLLVVTAVALQTLVFSRVSVLGVAVDFFFIFTFVVALTRGQVWGAAAGFVCGLLADISYFQVLGLHSLVYVLVGYFSAAVVERLGTVSPWGMILLGGVASFLSQFLYTLLEYITGPQAGFFTVVGLQVLPGAVLNALVTLPVYWFLARVRLVPPVGQGISGAEGR